MRNKRFISINLDFLGFSTSMLCAAHCAVIPLLLTMGSFSSMAVLLNPMVEGIAMALGLGFAFLSLLPAYFKKHHNPRPLLLMLSGSCIIISGHLADAVLPESILVPVGALAIAAAHYYNWNLNRKKNIKAADHR